jgi:hypothetical protein
MKYYISRAGQQYGPYSLEDLRNMQAQHQVDVNDLAWAEGMPAWTPLAQVLGSEPAPAAAPVAPPYTPAPQPQYQPPQYTPQVQAPAPAYAPPAYNPGYAPQPMAGGLMPPNLNWVLVLVLVIVTGIFGIVWTFIQLGFVKKIDPASTAMKQYIMGLVALPVGFILFGILFFAGSTSSSNSMVALGALCLCAAYIFAFVFMILSIFGMRRSIENYYNTVEPIGLRLNPVMTFFFNTIYFQYHFDRIINWKTTGRLM